MECHIWNLGGNLFSLRGMTYFAAGMFVRWHPIRIKWRSTAVFAGVAWLVAQPFIPKGLCARIVEIAMIPFAMWAVFVMCKVISLPQGITAKAFPIYLMHNLIVFVISGIYGAFGIARTGSTGFGLAFLRFGIAVIASLAIARTLERCAPSLAALLFVGRIAIRRDVS